jgi:hypothetical protein
VSCAHCGNPHEGRYCPFCGQPVVTGRLTIRRVFRDAVADVFNVDRGFLHTLIALFTAPARVAHTYIETRTIGFTTPIKYYVVLTTIGQLVAWQIGVIQAITEGFMEGFTMSAASAGALAFMNQNIILLSTLSLPPLALFARLLFRSAGFNIAEIVVLYLYVLAQISVIFIVIAPFANLFTQNVTDWLLLGMMVIQLAYFIWATVTFFKAPLLTGLLRALAVAVLSFVAFALGVGLAISSAAKFFG